MLASVLAQMFETSSSRLSPSPMGHTSYSSSDRSAAFMLLALAVIGEGCGCSIAAKAPSCSTRAAKRREFSVWGGRVFTLPPFL